MRVTARRPATVPPFATVAADPGFVHEPPWLQAAYRTLGLESVEASLARPARPTLARN